MNYDNTRYVLNSADVMVMYSCSLFIFISLVACTPLCP